MECPVCYESTRSVDELHCGHKLCCDCSQRWFSNHNTCPLCRSVLFEQSQRDHFQLEADTEDINIPDEVSIILRVRDMMNEDLNDDELIRMYDDVYNYVMDLTNGQVYMESSSDILELAATINTSINST